MTFPIRTPRRQPLRISAATPRRVPRHRAFAASRDINHICAPNPLRKRRTNNSGNECDPATRKPIAALSSGPAIMTGRRPKRSISQPDGNVPRKFPSRNIVTTPLATPKLTLNDLASVGIAGSAIPVPSASISAGKYVERNASHETAAPRCNCYQS